MGISIEAAKVPERPRTRKIKAGRDRVGKGRKRPARFPMREPGRWA